MKKILLISHQLDYSGAPIALLALGRSLVAFGCDVFVYPLQRGALIDDFLSAGIRKYRPFIHRRRSFDLVVANTVISVPAALRFSKDAGKVLAWIHESRYFFEFLGHAPSTYGLQHLKYAAFPAAFQIPEFAPCMPQATLFQLRNCVDAAPTPGADDLPGRAYFVCAGAWEDRKSQHRLVSLVRQRGQPMSIQFVGASRPPGILDEGLAFTGKVPLHEARRRISSSRGVISASVAEVQPLVPIEALLAGRPVLLSDIPAHRELRDLVADVLLFDPDDLQSFERGVAALEHQWQDQALRLRMAQTAQLHFGRESFDRSLGWLLEQVG